jgi:hypothetical protein
MKLYEAYATRRLRTQNIMSFAVPIFGALRSMDALSKSYSKQYSEYFAQLSVIIAEVFACVEFDRKEDHPISIDSRPTESYRFIVFG